MFNDLLHFINRFIPVSSVDLDFIKQRTEIKHYQKKEQLIKEGEVEDRIFYIVKGLTRQFFYKGKQEVVIDIVSEGTITGSVTSFFTERPSRYFIVAMEPVTAITITRQHLEDLYQLSDKWERFGRVLTAHFLLQQERHILDNIRFTVRERFSNFMEEHPGLLLRVSQKYLASYLDIKPETFSRLKHMTKERTAKTKRALI